MSARPPRLPPELEQHIFELLAYHDPLSVPTLKLIAWRVKQWVEKFLYRVVMLDGTSVYRQEILSLQCGYPYLDNADFSRIKAIAPRILQSSVHHLYLDRVPPDVLDTLLSTCTAVYDLWINLREDHESSILQMASHLRLRRLYCFADEIFGPGTPIDFTLPMFCDLTHLELFYSNILDPQPWAGIAALPHLTHFAFDGDVCLSLATIVLRTSRSLRVLIFMWDRDAFGPAEKHPEAELFTKDMRAVQMDCYAYAEDWKAGALGGSDYWSRAEAFIAWRVSKDGDPTQYILEEDKSMELVGT